MQATGGDERVPGNTGVGGDGAGAQSGNAASRVRSDVARCNFCNIPTRVRFLRVRDEITGEDFAIHECPSCDLGVTFPSVVDLDRYYGPAYWGGRHSFTADYCARRRVRLLSSLLKAKAGSRLLDFGCGDGHFLQRASKAGWTSVGFESSFSPIRPDAEYEVVRSHEALLARAPFDAITVWHVLEHVPNPLQTLRDLHGMLSPNGVLIIAVPDAGGVQATAMGAQWMHLDVPRHLYHMNRSSLERGLELAGMAPIRWWNHEFEYDLMGWSQSILAKAGMPTAFFNAVTGRMKPGPRQAAAIGLGSAVSLGALPLAMLWGSTITVAARRAGETARP
jgi:SAM-dependent methyltransferase